MTFFVFLVFAMAVVSVFFRSIVTSKYSIKFNAHDVWMYDVGARYCWLLAGPAGLAVVLLTNGNLSEFLGLGCAWFLSAAAVWVLPRHILRFFSRG